jgi:1-deoxy-D-xylulose-5-phosphate reductoisomerase
MKHIAVLGSTGSIGTQTLDVVRKHPDMMDVVALACGSKIDLIEKQAREFCPELVAVYDEKAASDLAVRLADTNVRVLSGMDGLIEMCRIPSADVVVTAIVGMIGIRPTIAAIEAGKDIALANKETCVCAGHIILPLAVRKGVKILPVDSEHSAIFQALQGRAGSAVRRILLTASGGPFRGRTRDELINVTAAEALAHPTWSMGPKITVDSASMVNKGLEVIEAKWLFDVDVDQIEVVIQPQSIIHSAVEYEDGSILAQMGPSDMRIAIQYALTYPLHLPSPAVPLDFRALTGLELGVPDNETFRGLPLAISAIRTGGSMPVVFNASNEWANAIFRRGDISFLQIYDVIEDTMSRHSVIADPTVDEIFAVQDEIDAYCEEKYNS